MRHLKEIKGETLSFCGEVSGEFEKKSLPTSERIDFKVGAQVMMLINDPEKTLGEWIDWSG